LKKSTLLTLISATLIAITGSAIPAHATDPARVEIDCPTETYWISTGDFAPTDLEEVSTGVWSLTDTYGNAAVVDCSIGCTSTDLKGSCHEGSQGTDAAIDVTCNHGDTFELTTGNNEGECTTELDNGDVSGGSCTSSSGSASVDCDANGGDGACSSTSGPGDCDCESCS